MLITSKRDGTHSDSVWAVLLCTYGQIAAHLYAECNFPGQESYATEQAAQLAHAVENSSGTVFANVISRDGPVAVSGTYLSVSIVQVSSTMLHCT